MMHYSGTIFQLIQQMVHFYMAGGILFLLDILQNYCQYLGLFLYEIQIIVAIMKICRDKILCSQR